MEPEQRKRYDLISNDQIDLEELFHVFWSAKFLILQITAIFAICSVAYSLSLENYYKSESLLLTRNGSEVQGLSQYSGLAAIAGVSLPSSGEDKAAQTIELIKSRKFVKHLLTFDNVLPSIMAAKSYDINSKELLFDKKIYDSETNTWKRAQSISRSVIPSYIEAHKVYSEIMTISKDTGTGFITINIEHISPIFAKELLELIIEESNELLRKKDMEESKQGIEYLTSELSKTPFIEIKESINSLIEAQLETQMLTQINEDYVLKEIEPPFVPEEKSRPSRALISILGTIFGGMLSLCIVLIRNSLIDKK